MGSAPATLDEDDAIVVVDDVAGEDGCVAEETKVLVLELIVPVDAGGLAADSAVVGIAASGDVAIVCDVTGRGLHREAPVVAKCRPQKAKIVASCILAVKIYLQ